jgi:uncharacterized protein (UPF0548 family)
MAVQPLRPELHERLRAAPLTYPAVGATATSPPTGYRSLSSARILRRRDFEATVEDLMSWRIHQRAGLRVASSSPRVQQDASVEMRLGIGPLALRIPCRVVCVIDEPERRGFAYGTLPGHPESGEELFLLQRNGDGQISFTITAFSREASLPARLGAPVTRWVQEVMTNRYLTAPDRLAT